MRKLAALLLAGIVISASVTHGIPPQINYQGQLAHPDGSPLDTTVAMTFRIYDAASGGSVIWTESHPAVTVQQGLFVVPLGFIQPIDDIFSAARWLGITIGGDSETAPRQPILSVAHAFRVGTVDGASGGTVAGDVIVSGKGNIGSSNTNFGPFAFVAGAANHADDPYSSVTGGVQNSTGGPYAHVGGGNQNAAGDGGGGSYQTVGGGAANFAGGDAATVGGGLADSAKGGFSTIAGGSNNLATGWWSFIGGGKYNRASGNYSAVTGGGGPSSADSNLASGEASVIPGGRANRADGQFSSAAGYRAKALHDGSFVWADSSIGDFASTASNQFLVRAKGGVGIGLNNPTEQLEVNGDVKADTFRADAGIRFPDGSFQNTAAGGGGQQYPDTNTWDATRTWVRSMGYLKGSNNVVNTNGAFVGGGSNNKARGAYAVIAGGGGTSAADSNSATGLNAAIGGGYGNRADGFHSFIGGGGENNAVSGTIYAVIGGGYRNATGAGEAPTVAGGIDNFAAAKAAVCGGDSNRAEASLSFIGGGSNNLVAEGYGTVGGGAYNTITAPYAVISGGGGPSFGNTASNWYSAIGGGRSNAASGIDAVVPGGYSNEASGARSFASGNRGKALHDGSFVWADGTSADFPSTANNQFNVRAAGGTRIFSNAALTAGVTLPPGGGSWVGVSDSTKKRDIRPANTRAVLDRVAVLPVKRWGYKSETEGVEHIGPMAQDFWNAFHLGSDSLGIATVDADGVLFAAVQELAKENSELKTRLARVEMLLQTQAAEQQKTLRAK